MRSRTVKRLLDLVGAASLLVVLGPVMVLIAAGIWLADGPPVLFRQRRPGRDGRPFVCRKFRTMRAPGPGEDPWTTDERRVTRLGRLLRRTSLDELPQLLNVLSGRMSLVGPRPLLMEYLPRYSDEHRRRHDVRPGITGLAQVNGRRALTFGQRLDLDVRYVREWTLAMDLRILARTLRQQVRSADIAGQRLGDVDDLGFHGTTTERAR